MAKKLRHKKMILENNSGNVDVARDVEHAIGHEWKKGKIPMA